MKQRKIRTLVKNVIQEYNDFRSPLVTAKLIKFDNESIKIQFEGTFTFFCCMDEYFLDFAFELKPKGVKAEITAIEEKTPRKFLVTYKITRQRED